MEEPEVNEPEEEERETQVPEMEDASVPMVVDRTGEGRLGVCPHHLMVSSHA